MSKNQSNRRSFLKGTVALGAALAIPLAAANAQANATPSAAAHIPVANSQFLTVAVRGSLYENPISMMLQPGQLSDPINLGARGTYRVKVTPVETSPRFGQIFSVLLADSNGKELGEMKLGNSATATFTRYGVQAYILSTQNGT